MIKRAWRSTNLDVFLFVRAITSISHSSVFWESTVFSVCLSDYLEPRRVCWQNPELGDVSKRRRIHTKVGRSDFTEFYPIGTARGAAATTSQRTSIEADIRFGFFRNRLFFLFVYSPLSVAMHGILNSYPNRTSECGLHNNHIQPLLSSTSSLSPTPDCVLALLA